MNKIKKIMMHLSMSIAIMTTFQNLSPSYAMEERGAEGREKIGTMRFVCVKNSKQLGDSITLPVFNGETWGQLKQRVEKHFDTKGKLYSGLGFYLDEDSEVQANSTTERTSKYSVIQFIMD